MIIFRQCLLSASLHQNVPCRITRAYQLVFGKEFFLIRGENWSTRLPETPGGAHTPTHPLQWHLLHVPRGSQWSHPIPHQILGIKRQPLGHSAGQRWARHTGTQRLRGIPLLPKMLSPLDNGDLYSGTLCLTFAVGTGRPQGAWSSLSEPLPWGVPWTKRRRASPGRESGAESTPLPTCQVLVSQAERALGTAHGCW